MRNLHNNQKQVQEQVNKGSKLSFNTSISGDLTQEEIDNLVFMYQEEKLAMDVYNYFYEIYDMRIFDKISDSELKHMNALNNILNIYEVDITAYQNLEEGEFLDEELQNLYDALINKGDLSLTDALEVGVTIEEVDIADLNELLENDTLNENIVTVYENLLNGSENHFEAFTNGLEIADIFIA